MKTPLSIQRINSDYSLEHMGYDSELEKSLHYLITNRSEYVLSDTDTQNDAGDTLYLLMPFELDEDAYCDFLESLALDDLITKVPTGFKAKLSNIYTDQYPNTVAWWDLDNHVIFCFGHHMSNIINIINKLEEIEN